MAAATNSSKNVYVANVNTNRHDICNFNYNDVLLTI